jgi:hypothetical protein
MTKPLLFALFFVSFQSIAQETEIQKIRNKLIVTGKIVDAIGLPLIGAKIIAKEINKETTTNFDGKFSLEVEEETIIYISFVGFKPIEVLVKPQTNIIFLLKEYDSTEVGTSVTRKEMRMIRRLRRDKNKGQSEGGADLIEQVFYTLKAIAE